MSSLSMQGLANLPAARQNASRRGGEYAEKWKKLLPDARLCGAPWQQLPRQPPLPLPLLRALPGSNATLCFFAASRFPFWRPPEILTILLPVSFSAEFGLKVGHAPAPISCRIDP